MNDVYWVIRRGTKRREGDYYSFYLGEPWETARADWVRNRIDADRFLSWEEAQDEVCGTSSTCRAVRVRPKSRAQKKVPGSIRIRCERDDDPGLVAEAFADLFREQGYTVFSSTTEDCAEYTIEPPADDVSES